MLAKIVQAISLLNNAFTDIIIFMIMNGCFGITKTAIAFTLKA